ncbi:hypothetical protein JG687_00013599 [Phytophthora cactorum]|uniref:Uncharacterized protein n=1 Tax=Phytophthora cactorum TaxID=29920 RepID=A0A8T1D8U9_9STRA|nr:hypothetical protein Pcac1_g5677 [Phytophthora cactorum]KAG2801934.1 hypothetical protein PC111_g19327 [Phytophthora cactorum]KAG2826669.1 hypothetical protein PC112_g9194 [Phytophthora cactorum]KAG2858364.1 hypothetical protein PC113_g9882 [Phytophthora cactorum]KAG2905053.1 hypothetical protein PC114_g11648 [Phytophthora cactorum]
MSDVVVPSFFPTPTEIAGGIRWVKQHPVVATAAAAAATAVSVLTYLKAAAEDERDLKLPVLSPCKENEADDLCSSTESDASTPSRGRTLSPRNLSFGELDAEAENDVETDVAVENSELEAALQAADGETVSPQWGWYVSTTPPEDYYQ